MEKEPQPKNFFDDCYNCDTKYTLTPENTVAFIYSQQAECNNLICVCPNCQATTRIFCDDATIQEAGANNISIIDETRPNHETWLLWAQIKGLELPKTYDLSPRHEKLIGEFAMILENCPDDLLYDAITTPQKPTIPKRWI